MRSLQLATLALALTVGAGAAHAAPFTVLTYPAKTLVCKTSAADARAAYAYCMRNAYKTPDLSVVKVRYQPVCETTHRTTNTSTGKVVFTHDIRFTAWTRPNC